MNNKHIVHSLIIIFKFWFPTKPSVLYKFAGCAFRHSLLLVGAHCPLMDSVGGDLLFGLAFLLKLLIVQIGVGLIKLEPSENIHTQAACKQHREQDLQCVDDVRKTGSRRMNHGVLATVYRIVWQASTMAVTATGSFSYSIRSPVLPSIISS